MPSSVIAAWTYVSSLYVNSAVFAFAVNMVASTVVSKAFANDASVKSATSSTPDPGSRAQVAPAGNNKLPVVYGSAYVGGIIVDMSLSNDNQQLYYVLALSEVTNTETGGTPDTMTFGNVYYSGKKCLFDSTDKTKVVGLYDESTGLTDSTVSGKIYIYQYSNGSSSGQNTSLTAIQVMQSAGLSYTWDSTKLMSNCAFAIIKLVYSQTAGVTGLQQTRFQITNSRYKPGDCLSDYLTSERYGAALTTSQIDSASLTELNNYCNESFTYTTYASTTARQTRFRYDGALETDVTVMNNLQLMAACCDCLLRYNELTGQWGVIVQSPNYSVAMDLTDSNLIGGITVSPLDIASSYNIAEVKYPDGSSKDSFSTAVFDLAVLYPALLYPNEPVNKQTISLPLVNNDVRAQYLANRFLEGAREDLQIKATINFTGLQLEAGDIVTLTNTNYGWTAKLFRINQVIQNFGDDGSVTATLSLAEFNAAVYDDVNITQFTPAPNTGIPDPSFFGTLPAPVISNIATSGYKPSFDVTITTSTNGVTQYAELWYSSVASPTSAQLTLAGTTAIAPDGNPYATNTALPAINLASYPVGTYYFFSRMRNSLRASVFSPPSNVLLWSPTYIDSVSAFINSGTILTWAAVVNYRLAGYKLRFQYGTNYDWNSANPLFSGVITTTTYDIAGLPSTRITLMIKAADTAGNESLTANSLVLTPGSALSQYIVYTYDFRATGWLGTITGGTISGGNIVANTTDSFYGEDDQSFYGLDSVSFYDLTSVASIVYTTAETLVSNVLVGSLGSLATTTLGKDVTIEYRRVNGTSFYGPDADSKYGPDADCFYGKPSDYALMPGNLAMANDYYQFRVTIGAGTIGEIDAMTLSVDAPVITETINNVTVTGGAISYTKTFTSIQAVLATLQTNALGVVTLETNKTNPLAPTITGYNSAHTAVSGAKADITLQGY